jgi:gliding motility-associated lipoprotein GldH
MIGFFYIILISSCNYVYRDFQEVKDMQWYRSDAKIFEFEIKNEAYYDMLFCMRHSTGYQFMSIKTKITMTTPDMNQFEKVAEFTVTDDKGRYVGEGTGQLWDIEEAFTANELMKKGKYKIKIEHDMQIDPVILVIDIGLKVVSTK